MKRMSRTQEKHAAFSAEVHCLSALLPKPPILESRFAFSYGEGTLRMRPQRLDNYLSAHRKNSGFSQAEVAFLLGCDDANQVSRYERRRHLPPLRIALAYEAIFGVPIAELFAGITKKTLKDVENRRLQLKATLQALDLKGSAGQMKAHKLRSLGWGQTNQNTPA